MAPVARKLKVGFESFKIINQPKTDVNLRFSSNNMQRLAALLNPAEQEEFLLLWKPQKSCKPRFSPVEGQPLIKALVRIKERKESASGSGEFHILATDLGSDSSSPRSHISADAATDYSAAASGAAAADSVPMHHGAELSGEAAEAVRRMREIPVEWRTFHINLGAYLYCSMFKMPLPANEMPISKPEVVAWLNIKPEDQVMRHQFVLYK